ncbi:DUF4129 domain-containing protein [Cellulomonas sp. JZ18]|uniref:DUF4129 domain-containing protein n=1 Tax=Cellulomonas sp. JZ18 TaxID=2654191 RepID=UPI0012D39ECF|nr:DUF4129 domain-containing protein [Cellulomonas sp. JZ18]QGQ18906.1 DUF4129 domain-containing protein [Cellulomonas sp. JZ18]
MTPLGVPVTPDAPTARRWVLEELADPAYSRGESLLDRFVSWVLEQLAGMQGVGLPPRAALLVVVAVAVAVVLLALWVAGPVRGRLARRRVAREVLAGDDRRSAAALRAAADAAARAGDHSTAVAERFRAVVRGLEERGLLDERPGRTAHEAAQIAGRTLPDVADALARGGDRFDDVVYGERRASAEDDAAMRALDDAVRAARPARTDAVAAAAPGGGS